MKICPKCRSENEIVDLSCECGYLFVNDIEASRSQELEQIYNNRRSRIIKRTAVLTCCVVFVTAVVAQIGGFFPAQAVADSESAAPASIVTDPPVAAKQPLPPSPRFPDANVAYTVTTAVTGSAIEVIDSNNESHRVTLMGIRAPKLDENFGLESKSFLSNAVMNKSVTIRLRNFTKEADTIAEVLCDGSNIGLEQIRNGMGFLVVSEIAGLSEAEQRQYLEAAAMAKSGKHGIWSGKNTLEAGSTYDPVPASEPVRGPMNTPYESRAFGIKAPLRTGRTESGTQGRIGANEIAEPGFTPMVTDVPGPAPIPKSERVVKEPAETVNDSAAARAKPASSGRKFIRGPFGGCYYINSNGNRSYVDRSMCN